MWAAMVVSGCGGHGAPVPGEGDIWRGDTDTIRMTGSGVFDDALGFYERHYDILGLWRLRPGFKKTLGSKDDRCCRFCGRRPPEATFRLEAHAIPEALGNKSLFTNWECDACNHAFGRGIENDLGNWSKPMRTLSLIKGKGPVPTIKKGSGGGWRIESRAYGLHIEGHEGDPVLNVDEAARTMTFTLPRDSYTPVAVLKALVKIGLSVVPDAELANFHAALDWIRCPDHCADFGAVFPVVRTIVPGPAANAQIVLAVFRRKRDGLDVPYAFFYLEYGSEGFQVFLPSPERDRPIGGRFPSFPAFPHPLDQAASVFGPTFKEPLDLMSCELVKGEVVTVTMSFGESKPVAPASGGSAVG